MTRAWRRWAHPALLALAGAACGDDVPTGPIPDVSGSYSGSYIVQFLLNSQATRGWMRVDIQQTGETVTLSGEIDVSGAATPIPTATGILDATGFLELTTGGFSAPVNDEFCGNTRTISATVRFFVGTAEVAEHADTDFCGRVIFSSSLARQ